MENDQDKDPIIQAVKAAGRNCKPDEIITYPDRHKKTITAKITLDHPDRPIKIKIIAGYMEWCAIWQTFAKADFITFAEIEPFIFRMPKADREALRAAWDDNMSWRIYHAAEATHYKNPLVTPPGKSKKHPGKDYSTAKIRRYARHVYVFLEYWLERPREERPQSLTFFFNDNHFNLNNYTEFDRMGRTTYCSKKLTKEIIEIYFDTIIGDPDGDEYFFREYINCRRGLIILRRSYNKIGFLPNRYPLNKIFPPLKS